MSKSIKRMLATMAIFFMVIGMIVSATEGSEVIAEKHTTTSITSEERDIDDSVKPLLLIKEDKTEVSKPAETSEKSKEATTKKSEETTTKRSEEATTKKSEQMTTKKSEQPTTKVQVSTATTKVVVTETTKPVETTKPEVTVEKSLKEGTIVNPKLKESEIVLEDYVWEGRKLNSYNGTVAGPNGKETYYNLNMTGVVRIMKNLGYDYKYWIREDGVKMYGPFIMVAADLNLRPRGSIIKTSLGWGLVCDTGEFARTNPTQLDIAVSW